MNNQDVFRKLKNFASKITIHYVWIVVLGFYINSYYGYSQTQTSVFKVDDSWCTKKTIGIGEHCFGDFTGGLHFNFDHPWLTDSALSYPPLSTLYFKVFALIDFRIHQENAALYLHFLVLTICLAIPILHLSIVEFASTKKFRIILLTALFANNIVLIEIDRSNNIVLIFPLLYFFYLKLLKHDYSQASIFLILMILLRPQFILLSLFFLLRKKYRIFFTNTLFSAAILLLSFLLFPWKYLKTNIFSWAENTISYGQSTDLPMLYPTNWSFLNFYYLVKTLVLGKFPLEFSDHSGVVSGPKEGLIVLILYMGLTFAGLKYISNKINDFTLLTLILPLILLVPGVTYSYYLIFLLIPIIFVATLLGNQDFAVSQSGYSDQVISFTKMILSTKIPLIGTVVFLYCILLPWPINWNLLGFLQLSNSGLIGVNWSVATLMLPLLHWVLILKLFQTGEKIN